jgi:hypothetical protein
MERRRRDSPPVDTHAVTAVKIDNFGVEPRVAFSQHRVAPRNIVPGQVNGTALFSSNDQIPGFLPIQTDRGLRGLRKHPCSIRPQVPLAATFSAE